MGGCLPRMSTCENLDLDMKMMNLEEKKRDTLEKESNTPVDKLEIPVQDEGYMMEMIKRRRYQCKQKGLRNFREN